MFDLGVTLRVHVKGSFRGRVLFSHLVHHVCKSCTLDRAVPIIAQKLDDNIGSTTIDFSALMLRVFFGITESPVTRAIMYIWNNQHIPNRQAPNHPVPQRPACIKAFLLILRKEIVTMENENCIDRGICIFSDKN